MKIRSRPIAPHLLLLLLALAAGLAQAGAPVARAHRELRGGAGVLRPALRADVGVRAAPDVAPAVGYAPARAPLIAVAATLVEDGVDRRRGTFSAREPSRAPRARAPPALA